MQGRMEILATSPNRLWLDSSLKAAPVVSATELFAAEEAAAAPEMPDDGAF